MAREAWVLAVQLRLLAQRVVTLDNLARLLTREVRACPAVPTLVGCVPLELVGQDTRSGVAVIVLFWSDVVVEFNTERRQAHAEPPIPEPAVTGPVRLS